jgi:hypothetical protein
MAAMEVILPQVLNRFSGTGIAVQDFEQDKQAMHDGKRRFHYWWWWFRSP